MCWNMLRLNVTREGEGQAEEGWLGHRHEGSVNNMSSF